MRRKKTDWNIALFAFIDEVRSKPFKWGEWDCCVFSNAAIKVMTGKDLIPKDAVWDDKKTAIKTIRNYGSSIHEAVENIAKASGLVSIPTSFISAGDLAIFKNSGRNIAGICDGYSLLAPSVDGIECCNNELAVRAWRIV